MTYNVFGGTLNLAQSQYTFGFQVCCFVSKSERLKLDWFKNEDKVKFRTFYTTRKNYGMGW